MIWMKASHLFTHHPIAQQMVKLFQVVGVCIAETKNRRTFTIPKAVLYRNKITVTMMNQHVAIPSCMARKLRLLKEIFERPLLWNARGRSSRFAEGWWHHSTFKLQCLLHPSWHALFRSCFGLVGWCRGWLHYECLSKVSSRQFFFVCVFSYWKDGVFLRTRNELIVSTSSFNPVIFPVFSASQQDLGVSKNNGTPKSSIFNRVFHYFHHPFWGFSPYFWISAHVWIISTVFLDVPFRFYHPGIKIPFIAWSWVWGGEVDVLKPKQLSSTNEEADELSKIVLQLVKDHKTKQEDARQKRRHFSKGGGC